MGADLNGNIDPLPPEMESAMPTKQHYHNSPFISFQWKRPSFSLPSISVTLNNMREYSPSYSFLHLHSHQNSCILGPKHSERKHSSIEGKLKSISTMQNLKPEGKLTIEGNTLTQCRFCVANFSFSLMGPPSTTRIFLVFSICSTQFTMFFVLCVGISTSSNTRSCAIFKSQEILDQIYSIDRKKKRKIRIQNGIILRYSGNEEQ